MCILPGEVENQEAHQAERKAAVHAAQWMEVSGLLALDLSSHCLAELYILVPGCHVLSTAIYDDFGIKTLAFSENKSHSTDDGLERLKRQHCQASLSRKTCIRLKVGQREMCKSSFSCFALHMCVVVFILFFSLFVWFLVVLIGRAHCKFAIEEQVKR